MQHDTTIRSYPAIGIAGVFLSGTAFVLFQDVLHGQPVTTSHVLTGLALLATTAAGHYIWPTVRQCSLVLAAGLGLLAVSGLAYVATMSGARNAEVSVIRAERIASTNAERVRIERLRSEAEDMQRSHRAKLAAECSSPKGHCAGVKATLAVYDAAIRGHNSDLRRLGPAQLPYAGYKAAADAIAMVPGVGYGSADIERRLVVLMPWLAVLITELGAIVFLSLGLGSTVRRTVRPAIQAVTVLPEPEVFGLTVRDEDQGSPNRSISKQAALSALITDLALGKRFASQDELAERFGRSKSTISEWLGEWERDGLIPARRTVGRCKTVAK